MCAYFRTVFPDQVPTESAELVADMYMNKSGVICVDYIADCIWKRLQEETRQEFVR